MGMKRYQRRRLNKLAIDILKGLAVGGLIITALALPNIAQIAKILDLNKRNEKLKVRRAIKSLQKYDLVQVTPGKSLIEQKIRISRAGNEFMEYEGIKLPKLKKWDGKWRVIMFDIPEEFFKARRALSLKLRELGCYHYQNSVFVYPHDCSKEMKFVEVFFGFKGYIKLMLAEKVDDQETLEDYFKL